MITPRTSSRNRRALALGVMAVGLILGFGRGLPAWKSWVSEATASAQELAAELQRARAATHSTRGSAARLRVDSARLDSAGTMLLDAPSPEGAAAELATVLSTAAEETAVRVVSIETKADSAAGQLFAASARVNAVGDVRGLAEFLSAIEGGPYLLRVRSLAVSQPELGAAADRAEALRIDVTVDGRARAPRSKEAP